ncbi:GNAT family N-acetyltransferase [Herpetosiphon gulosus]|uniref:L-amino acid N-acetyltransferase AaaT n=1 Tax=Herpetosiphon gulosus TaxID=1973496 RepID=A0ABP9WUA3_9CHLR
MSKTLDIIIRALEPDDYLDLATVFSGPNVLDGSLHVPFPSQDVWRRRVENPDTETPRLVATIDAMVVGIISLEIGEGRRRHAGDLELAVRDDYQGRGIGGALMAAMIDLAENWLGLSRLEIVVFTDNTPAITLYKRFDFAVEGTLRNYAYRGGKLSDAYTMARLAPTPA